MNCLSIPSKSTSTRLLALAKLGPLTMPYCYKCCKNKPEEEFRQDGRVRNRCNRCASMTKKSTDMYNKKKKAAEKASRFTTFEFDVETGEFQRQNRDDTKKSSGSQNDSTYQVQQDQTDIATLIQQNLQFAQQNAQLEQQELDGSDQWPCSCVNARHICNTVFGCTGTTQVEGSKCLQCRLYACPSTA